MDAWVEPLADVAAMINKAPARLGGVRLVAVDGPAGSGKTTFAGRLARSVRDTGASVVLVHSDDLLVDWADIFGFWPRLRESILAPLGTGHPGRYRRYDWRRGEFDAQWVEVPVPDVLIVEGVTSARAEGEAELSLSIYLIADRRLRLTRGLARDGESVRDEWLRWMADEDRHFAADGTRSRADLVVDGAPTIRHDPETEYVRLLAG